MQIFKTKFSAVIVVVLLMASVALMTMPIQAQEDIQTHGSPSDASGMPNLGPLPAGVTPAYTIVTVAYLSFRPNPIGVGQTLLVNMWTSPGQYHCFYMNDYIVRIQDPDGNEQVVGPMDSYLGDASAWFEYVPEKAGTYKLKFEQEGTYLPAGNYTDRPGVTPPTYYYLYQSVLYAASETGWQELTVLPDMVASYPAAPLPTDYWTRPAYPDKREWYSILGNYPWTGAYYYPNGRVLYSSNYKYTAYVQAPNSAHVVWKRQGAIAGLIGGELYQYSTSAGGGSPSIIYSGRCYQTTTKQILTLVNGTYQYWPTSVWECYDLRTGEAYWDITGATAPTNILYEPPGASIVAGAEASQSYSVSLVAISGNRLYKYNPYTGAASLNISIAVTPALSSSTIYNNEWVLSVQNIGNTSVPNYRLINWTMSGTSTNFTSRIATGKANGYLGTWNISWPRSSLGTADFDAGIAVSNSWNTPPGPQWCIGHLATGVDIQTGIVLWTHTTNDTLTENNQGTSTLVNRGKFAFGAHGRHWTCFDGRTGNRLWTSEQTEYPWGAWWPYNMASYDFNETTSAIITSTYEGVYAINWEDGKILWHYQDPNVVPFEDPYDATPFFTGVSIADGKIYAFNGEHSPSQPLTRGWSMHCINATTGELVWKILGPMTPGAIADGYLTASNTYDGYMYVFGKGKSAATVTAEPAVIAKGATVLVKGTVLDMSPGQPNTPCVSKDSMATQMEYLHLQQPIDGIWHNLTINGVPVVLTAIKSDGTVIDIGSTTTNGYYGTFSQAWTPPDEGTYTIMASFAGDDSYGSSTSATAVAVGPAPETPTPPEIPTPVDNTMLLNGILVAVIVAILISLAALMSVFRKK